MEKYLIAFDLDGTMLPKVSTLPDEVRDIIRRLKADGHIPVIASARPQVMCDWVYEAMELDTIMILLNGSLIMHPKDKNFIPRETVLSEETLAMIWERALTAAPDPHQIYIEYANDFWYLDEGIESSYWSNRLELSHSRKIPDLSKAPHTKANRIVFFHRDPAKNEAIEAALADCEGLFWQTLYTEDKNGVRSYRTMIFDKRISKLVGVRLAQELYGIPDERVLTFGDEWNDYAMLRAFKGGYALKGSAADREGVAQPTDASCADAGVAKTLERLFYA